MARVYLLLGSNLGPRLEYLRRARRGLAALGLRVLRSSPIYWTRPLLAVGESEAAPRPWYMNQLLEAETDLSPDRLLRRLQRLERQSGRPSVPRRPAPRTLDLDLIAYGRLRWHSPVLVLPHERWRDRPFLLALLSEFFPHGRAPESSLSWTPPPPSPDFRRLGPPVRRAAAKHLV